MKRFPPPGKTGGSRLKKAKNIHDFSGSSGQLQAPTRSTTKIRCEVEAPTAIAQLTVGSGVLFYKAIAGMSTPTPTRLQVGIDIRNGDYTGNAELSVNGPGRVQVYTNADCTALRADELSAAAPLRVFNDELKGGQPFFLRGTNTGQMVLTLTLDPGPGVDARSSATRITVVVEVSIRPHRRQRDGIILPDSLRYVHGHLLPVPAIATKPRAKLEVLAEPAGSTVALNIATPCIHLHSHQTNATANGMGVPDVAPLSFWAEGVAPHVPILVEASLVLEDGTVLHHGDHVLYEPVAQAAISMGLEWEIPGFKVQARHTELTANNAQETLEPRRKWMNAPSKSVVFASEKPTARHRMKIAVEMSIISFGEFVLGPFYDHAQLEAALGEVKRVVDFVKHHKVVVSRNHPDMLSTNANEFNDIWAVANSKITLSNESRNWDGTAQASFGAPLWKLPQVLSELDHVDGIHAAAIAEATDVNERVCGLIAAVEYYIACLGPGTPGISASDGPKTKTPVMFRTDFAAMYNTLSDQEKLAFRTWAGARAERTDYMMPGGQTSNPKLAKCTRSMAYRLRHGLKIGPTIGDWLDSISAPGPDGKDCMSPPPNLPRHTTPQSQAIPYAMGLMGVDTTTNHVIAEYRNLGPANSYSALFALAFSFAADRELDGAPTWVEGGEGWAPQVAAVAPALGAATPYAVLPAGA